MRIVIHKKRRKKWLGVQCFVPFAANMPRKLDLSPSLAEISANLAYTDSSKTSFPDKIRMHTLSYSDGKIPEPEPAKKYNFPKLFSATKIFFPLYFSRRYPAALPSCCV